MNFLFLGDIVGRAGRKIVIVIDLEVAAGPHDVAGTEAEPRLGQYLRLTEGVP